ncbi:MAG TPA: hypothetical protein GXX38_08740 [Clostridia bacterium]|nr:hypothetical protein [Clostridia bacterium]
MEPVVGIPRALLYYHYNWLWENFFNFLGVEVIVSPPTNKQILNNGVSFSVDEACLPVKVFMGHCFEIKDKVDYIFLPRMISGKKREYFCPKLMGIPDMVKNNLSNLPSLIIPTIDLSKSKRNLYPALFEIGKMLGKKEKKIIDSYNKALKIWEKERKQKVLETSIQPKGKGFSQDKPKIAVISHSYTLYDNYMNMDLIKRLQTMGVETILPEMLPSWAIEKGLSTFNKRMYWSLGRRIMGSAKYYFNHPECIDGIILLVAFGCGPDSLIGELIEREAKRIKKLPLLLLTLDEHSGEAGLITRIEAFIDLIQRRKKVG